jgi:hypothetical protein
MISIGPAQKYNKRDDNNIYYLLPTELVSLFHETQTIKYKKKKSNMVVQYFEDIMDFRSKNKR